MQRRCPKCGEEWEIKGPIGFREECPECAAFLHTCANCVHYEAGVHGCRIPTTDAVHDRESVNFCEEFEFATGDPARRTKTAGPARPADARPAPGTPQAAEEARRRFENLFRDPPK